MSPPVNKDIPEEESKNGIDWLNPTHNLETDSEGASAWHSRHGYAETLAALGITRLSYPSVVSGQDPLGSELAGLISDQYDQAVKAFWESNNSCRDEWKVHQNSEMVSQQDVFFLAVASQTEPAPLTEEVFKAAEAKLQKLTEEAKPVIARSIRKRRPAEDSSRDT